MVHEHVLSSEVRLPPEEYEEPNDVPCSEIVEIHFFRHDHEIQLDELGAPEYHYHKE